MKKPITARTVYKRLISTGARNWYTVGAVEVYAFSHVTSDQLVEWLGLPTSTSHQNNELTRVWDNCKGKVTNVSQLGTGRSLTRVSF